MLFKRVTYPLRNLLNKNFCLFSSPKHEQEEQTKPTKHNPHASKDLRGYEHIEQILQSERNFNNLHSTEVSRTSAYFAISKLSNAVTKALGTICTPPHTFIASDSLNLPKIHSEGVPIYDSIHGVSNEITTRKLLSKISPAIVIFLTSEPFISLFYYGSVAAVIYAFRLRISKDIVLKLELLPNTEEIVYQKINFFGSISTQKVKISDLEFYGFGETEQADSSFSRALRGYINRDVSFSFKKENKVQKLFFDKNGIWHQEGLSHQLLV